MALRTITPVARLIPSALYRKLVPKHRTRLSLRIFERQSDSTPTGEMAALRELNTSSKNFSYIEIGYHLGPDPVLALA